MTGLWSILLPEATTNLITNPSCGVDTTGYAGTSLARDTVTFRRGSAALSNVPAAGVWDGVNYLAGTLIAGQAYTLSMDVWGAAGVPYQLFMQNLAGTNISSPTFVTGDAQWHRYTNTWTNVAAEDIYLWLTKNNNASMAKFYLDGVQLEAKAYATTYCDGSIALSASEQQAGFIDDGVAWTGTAHASTSTRTATSRRGGRWWNLDAWQFYVESVLGLGTPPVGSARVNSANPKLPGSLFEHSHEHERVLTLQGTLQGTTLADLNSNRDNLAYYMRVNPNGSSGDDEPFLLRYAGGAATKEIPVHYEGGLEGGALSGFNERLAIRMIADYPYWTTSLL